MRTSANWAAAFAVALAAMTQGFASVATAASATTVKIQGVVIDTGVDGAVVWFKIDYGSTRFWVSAKDGDQLATLKQALADSASTSQALTVAFDPSSGTIDSSSSTPDFSATEVDYGGGQIILAPPPTRTEGDSSPSTRALAVGLGLKLSEDWAGARARLQEALADKTLSRPLRSLALEALGDVAQSQAYECFGPSLDCDRLLIEALDAYEEDQKEGANSWDAARQIAHIYAELGDFDLAQQEFKAMAAKWPESALRAATGESAVYRALGENDKALDVLDRYAREHAQDQYAREHGGDQGMAYHYHRGWTLYDLGRDREAVADFTAGLKSQPDYPYVFVRRACSLARLGRASDALADARKAAELLAAVPEPRPSASLESEQRWTASLVDLLSKAAASGRTARLDACVGEPTRGVPVRRARSPLLDQRSSASAEAAPAVDRTDADPSR